MIVSPEGCTLAHLILSLGSTLSSKSKTYFGFSESISFPSFISFSFSSNPLVINTFSWRTGISSLHRLLNVDSSPMSSSEALDAPANNLCISILANIGSDDSDFEGAFSFVLVVTGILDPIGPLMSAFEMMGESTENAFKEICEIAFIPEFTVGSISVSRMTVLEAADKSPPDEGIIVASAEGRSDSSLDPSGTQRGVEREVEAIRVSSF
mmetsp:Transcript_1382/g.1519  ORF Transcript_1382/g.1519 Transcript_1382/m.1519 type:complete len:210 (-) Transcript_1382:149-778(-)